MKLRDDDLKKALAGMKKTEWELPAGFADRVMGRVRRARRRPFWFLASAAAAAIVAAVVFRAAWLPVEAPPQPQLALPNHEDRRELEALREEYQRLLLDLERARMLANEPVAPFGPAHDDFDLFLDVRSFWERPPSSFSGEPVIPVSQRER